MQEIRDVLRCDAPQPINRHVFHIVNPGITSQCHSLSDGCHDFRNWNVPRIAFVADLSFLR